MWSNTCLFAETFEFFLLLTPNNAVDHLAINLIRGVKLCFFIYWPIKHIAHDVDGKLTLCCCKHCVSHCMVPTDF